VKVSTEEMHVFCGILISGKFPLSMGTFCAMERFFEGTICRIFVVKYKKKH